MIEQIHESLIDFSDYKEEQKDLEPNTNFVLKKLSFIASTLASFSLLISILTRKN